MDPFDVLILNDIDEDMMTELEKETIRDEYLFDEVFYDEEFDEINIVGR